MYKVHISLIDKAERPALRRLGKTFYMCSECNAILPKGTPRPPTDEKGYRHKWGEYTEVEIHPWRRYGAY